MKKILIFAATTLFFASCNNNQETADKARIDSMSQELAKQHIIDSMNNAAPVVGASPVETTVPVAPSHVSSSRSSSRGSHSNNSANSGNANVTSAAPVPANTSTGPTAAELAAKKKEENRKKLNSTASGAMIGAGAGAIVGAVAGKNDHFKKEDALIGGGVGAVVGAGTGYLLQKRKLKKADTTHR